MATEPDALHQGQEELSIAERYPSLFKAGLKDRVIFQVHDCRIPMLSPEQAEAIMDLCMKEGLPVPRREGGSTESRTELCFDDDWAAIQRVLYLVGDLDGSEILRDPDFSRAHVGGLRLAFRTAMSAIGLKPLKPEKNTQEVAAEMKGILHWSEREAYLLAWQQELMGNGLNRNSATNFVEQHLQTLEGSGLLTAEEIGAWKGAFALLQNHQRRSHGHP